MTTQTIANLEKLIDGPRDGELLRYSLGNEYLKAGDFAKAAQFLRDAVTRNPNHSAAWKLLGKALSGADDKVAALEAFERGRAVAEAKGDVQAAKEMSVFAKRLRRALGELAS